MTINPGSYEFTAAHGSLRVYTTKQGLAGAIGHDLTLEVGTWSATVQLAPGLIGSTLEMCADLTSLTVIDGRGGAKPLSDKDRRDIIANASKALHTNTFPGLRYTATVVDDGTLTGELTLAGRSAPQNCAVDESGPGSLRVSGIITQTRFAIKPFSAMLGALRISDDVRFEVTVTC